MSKPLIFPYGINLQDGGKVNLFPCAKVEFKSKKAEWFTLFLVIDSGATVSALPKGDSEILGIDISAGLPTLVAGIGNEYMKGWQHNVIMRLNGEQLKVPIIFLDNDHAPRILGRTGIFDRFSIVLEESMKRTGFFGERTNGYRIIRKLLNAN